MTPEVSFANVVIIAAVAFFVPLLLGFVPRLRLPAAVLEIVAGVVIGPSGFGWVQIDLLTQVLALIGVAWVLFLAGLEIEFDQLRGRVLTLAGLAFVVSLGLALLVGYGLLVAGLVQTPLFIAIVLAATALGVLIPVLKDSGESESPFGQLVIAAASIADFSTIILLSLLFGREGRTAPTQLALIGGFAVVAVLAAIGIRRVERSTQLGAILVRLQDTTAQIRVRGAFLLLLLFVALAERIGLEVILGAFIAGAILKLVDRDRQMTHPQFRRKLETIGFGVFIPAFYVTSGVRFDARALLSDARALVLVPVFLVALLVVRGVPALLYWRLLGRRRTLAAALLQATSLSFIVVAAQIGVELGVVSAPVSTALIAAGILSVVLFPLAALTILGN